MRGEDDLLRELDLLRLRRLSLLGELLLDLPLLDLGDLDLDFAASLDAVGAVSMSSSSWGEPDLERVRGLESTLMLRLDRPPPRRPRRVDVSDFLAGDGDGDVDVRLPSSLWLESLLVLRRLRFSAPAPADGDDLLRNGRGDGLRLSSSLAAAAFLSRSSRSLLPLRLRLPMVAAAVVAVAAAVAVLMTRWSAEKRIH